jgi:phage shock protein A
MEDTLVEIKTACAGVMAGGKKIKRQLEGLGARAQYWEEKAELAVTKGRDDLAREALVEKRKFNRRIETLENDLAEHDLLIEQYQDDIRQLEEKLKSARDKQRMLVQRHIHAQKKMQAQEKIRRIDSSETVMKFDELENRIERMEAESDLVNYGKKTSLEEELERLSVDEEIENELRALKTPVVEKPSSDKKNESTSKQ